MTESWDEPPSRSYRYSFREWATYYESTERVTDRRLAVNASNFSISIALLVGIGVLANWAASHTELRALAIGGVILISILGVIFCSLWVGQIYDYKNLNSAKFSVLNFMAPYVRFDEEIICVSAEPFDREWKIVKEKGWTIKVPFTKITALRSSYLEFAVPISAIVVFIAAGVLAFCTISINWRTLQRHTFELPSKEVPVTAPSYPALTGHAISAPRNTP